VPKNKNAGQRAGVGDELKFSDVTRLPCAHLRRPPDGVAVVVPVMARDPHGDDVILVARGCQGIFE